MNQFQKEVSLSWSREVTHFIEEGGEKKELVESVGARREGLADQLVTVREEKIERWS